MGYSISWLATRTKTPEALLQQLGLVSTGAFGDYGKLPFVGRMLPDEWFLLIFNRCEHRFIGAQSLSAVSQDCELVACSAEEHVMVCHAELWRNGARIWRVEHDAQQSFDHISAMGALPDNYAGIHRECSVAQERDGGRDAGVDHYFDIPLALSRSIVGFKHDEDCGLEDGSFAIYATASATTSPWWKLWG